MSNGLRNQPVTLFCHHMRVTILNYVACRSEGVRAEAQILRTGGGAAKQAMIEPAKLRSLVENLERTAEEILRQDVSFAEVLQALKSEIGRDSQVKRALGDLRAVGSKVCSAFFPRIRIRLKKGNGIFALPKHTATAYDPAAQVNDLVQKLRHAVRAMLMNSTHRQKLGMVVNEAVAASSTFEAFASELETCGYEVIICLDFYDWVRIVNSATALVRSNNLDRPDGQEPPGMTLSAYDRNFLRDLRIKADRI